MSLVLYLKYGWQTDPQMTGVKLTDQGCSTAPHYFVWSIQVTRQVNDLTCTGNELTCTENERTWRLDEFMMWLHKLVSQTNVRMARSREAP